MSKDDIDEDLDAMEEETEEDTEEERIKAAVKGETGEKLRERAKQEFSAVESIQIPTAHQIGFKLPNGKILSYEDYLVWVGNQLIKIQKAIG